MTERLFFALWPSEQVRASLGRRIPDLMSEVSGKPQRPDQWHVTLEFIGQVPAERVPALQEAAGRVRAESFTEYFDELDYWRRPRVYCLAAARPNVRVVQLVERLRAALTEEGFTPEDRQFWPHVTLARKVKSARRGRLEPPLAWPADRFALVRSVTDPAGSRYEPLRWWNLSGQGD